MASHIDFDKPETITGKKVLVLGLGLLGGGVGVCRFFAHHGATVTVFDAKASSVLSSSVQALSAFKSIVFSLDGQMPVSLESYDMVIKGPSFPSTHPILIAINRLKIPVTMEAALFVRFAHTRIIGVTGTRGKSTVTRMISDALRAHYTRGRVFESGNIPGTCALELLYEVKPEDVVVLELSSWQLAGLHMERVSPELAGFTSMYPDHLNFYVSMREYIHDKTAIFAYQSKGQQLFIAENCKGDVFEVATPPEGVVTHTITENDFTNDLRFLQGQHNRRNAALALAVTHAVLPEVQIESIADTIRSSHSLSCRQEVIAQKGQVTVVNDSASTTPVACAVAIETFHDRAIILVLGGNSKNVPLDPLIEKLAEHKTAVKRIYFLPGTCTDELMADERFARVSIPYTRPQESFESTIALAFATAEQQETPTVLLFSPAATSFAQFRNEFHRGEIFHSVISAIIAQ